MKNRNIIPILIFQISLTWNGLIEEHLNKIPPLPIKDVRLYTTDNSELEIGLKIRNEYVTHFGIEKWERVIEFSNEKVGSTR